MWCSMFLPSPGRPSASKGILSDTNSYANFLLLGLGHIFLLFIFNLTVFSVKLFAVLLCFVLRKGLPTSQMLSSTEAGS